MYTDEEGLQADRERTFCRNFTAYNYRNGKSIRLYNEQQLIEDKHWKAHSIIMKIYCRCYANVTKWDIVMNFIDILAYLILYAFAIFRAVNGAMTAGEVVPLLCILQGSSTHWKMCRRISAACLQNHRCGSRFSTFSTSPTKNTREQSPQKNVTITSTSLSSSTFISNIPTARTMC